MYLCKFVQDFEGKTTHFLEAFFLEPERDWLAKDAWDGCDWKTLLSEDILLLLDLAEDFECCINVCFDLALLPRSKADLDTSAFFESELLSRNGTMPPSLLALLRRVGISFQGSIFDSSRVTLPITGGGAVASTLEDCCLLFGGFVLDMMLDFVLLASSCLSDLTGPAQNKQYMATAMTIANTITRIPTPIIRKVDFLVSVKDKIK